MTVIPDAEQQTLSLVCDACGQAIKEIECPAAQWAVVWAVVSRTGWTGVPLAIGPHHCPPCGEFPTSALHPPSARHPAPAERSQA